MTMVAVVLVGIVFLLAGYYAIKGNSLVMSICWTLFLLWNIIILLSLFMAVPGYVHFLDCATMIPWIFILCFIVGEFTALFSKHVPYRLKMNVRVEE